MVKLLGGERGALGSDYWPKLVSNPITLVATTSKSETKPASRIIATRTTIVESTSSLYFWNPLTLGSFSHGHDALRSSALTSWIKVALFLNMLIGWLKFLGVWIVNEKSWQGRQDSNLQLSVLETDALPIELLPCDVYSLYSRCLCL